MFILIAILIYVFLFAKNIKLVEDAEKIPWKAICKNISRA